MMTIRIRLFALLRDRAGVGETDLPMPENATVASAVTVLIERFPALRDAAPRVMYAVNQEYAALDMLLKDGDELALIPPVSGG
jgi:molybdopterin converting factor subunit 1